jgi:YegS/Rv2252/BmrU family lipid kinase
MHNQKWLIIANPSAGNGKVNRKLTFIEKLLQSNAIEYEMVRTKKRGDGIFLAKKGITDGFRNIMAIGGDGTNNEVINGIVQQKIVPSQSITYSLLPIGTGNDWIKTHGIPKNVENFISMLKKGKTTFQDIGVVTFIKNGEPQKRHFANVAGMAYDAFVVKKTEKQGGIFSNKLFYLISLIRYLFQYKLQKAKIQFNDVELTDYFYTINVGICRFAGGGMEIVPHAVPDDGKLAITIAGRFSKLEVLLNTYRFYNGSIAKLSKISTHLSTNVKVESLEERPVFVEVDGEFLGNTPVEFGIIPKALKILIP